MIDKERKLIAHKYLAKVFHISIHITGNNGNIPVMPVMITHKLCRFLGGQHHFCARIGGGKKLYLCRRIFSFIDTGVIPEQIGFKK